MKKKINRRKIRNVSKKHTSFVSKPVKMKIKKGDIVVVVSGKDKGKKGEVMRVFPATNRVVIDGVGMVKRHLKSAGRGQSGRIAERPASIHASNVMVFDKEANKPSRIGREKANGKNVRMTKKSKTVVK